MKQITLLGALVALSAALPTLASAQVCGDGLIDLSETCDDGNTASMDGCDASCNIETGWGCSCASPTFSYSSELSAGRIGGVGGGAGPQMGCAGSDVLIGLAIDWSNSRGEGVRTRALCGSVSVNASGVVTTTPTVTQESGGAGCGGWDPSTFSPNVSCPSGWAVVGLTGTASSLSGTTTLFKDLNIVCQQMGVDGNPAGPTMTLNIPGGAGGSGTAQAVSCPPNTIARFFQTRAGCAQDALDIFCGVPAVTCIESPSICATQCGDGVVGAPVEACDDGNSTAGDGCDASCAIEAGWSCPAGGPCVEVCGDSVVVGAEACDTGGESASCNADCTLPSCGDGNLNLAAGETCDDGGSVDGDGCSATCTTESGWSCGCGAPTFTYSMEMNAGRIGGPDGGAGPQMGCGSSDVLIGLAINWSDARGEGVRTRALCGSVSVDATGAVTTTATTTEENGGSGCFGWDPSTWSPDVTCPTGWAVVGLTGSLPAAGTTLFTDLNIVCQQMGVDGNPAGPTMTLNIPGGGSTAGTAQAVSCPPNTIARFFQTRAGCGQDALDLFCGVPAASCAGTSSICATQCGDGVIGAPTETCDDGNAIAGDGCDASCQLESGWSCMSAGIACGEICGDSIVVGAEDCDDGTETATCDGDCTSVVCGDGRLNTTAGEGCDEGAMNSDTTADACRTSCVLASCGDSVVDTGESCDEGAANADTAGATCRTSCALASCGDGVLDTGEECDDGEGNADVADSCRTTCVSPACSDGIVDTGEVCDDGAANSDATADACRTSCQPASCGDSVVDTGEDCDDGAAGSATCSASCATVVPRMDAGVDAGMDGGSADAGSDASMPDGGADGGRSYGLSGGAGCSAPGGANGGGSPWAVLGVLGLLLWRRRRS